MVRKFLGKLNEGIKALNAELKRPLGAFKSGRSHEAAPRKSEETDRPPAQKKATKDWPELASSRILKKASKTTFGKKIEEKKARKEENRRRIEDRLKRLTGKEDT